MTQSNSDVPPTPIYGFRKIQTNNISWKETVGIVVNENLDKIEQAIIEAACETDYRLLSNKPKINGVELVEDVSLAEIGAVAAADITHETFELKYDDDTVTQIEIVTWQGA